MAAGAGVARAAGAAAVPGHVTEADLPLASANAHTMDSTPISSLIRNLPPRMARRTVVRIPRISRPRRVGDIILILAVLLLIVNAGQSSISVAGGRRQIHLSHVTHAPALGACGEQTPRL